MRKALDGESREAWLHFTRVRLLLRRRFRLWVCQSLAKEGKAEEAPGFFKDVRDQNGHLVYVKNKMPSSGFSGATGWCQPAWIQILLMPFGPFLNDSVLNDWHTVTLFKQYLSSTSNTLPSTFEGEMQEIIWLCRCSQTHLMASISTFLNKCWGKGWKMWVLACGNWFCETLDRCHPSRPDDPGAPEAGLYMWRVKTFGCWPFSTQEMN